jgi:N-carbamoyl-L-amino-acid hydrolase
VVVLAAGLVVLGSTASAAGSDNLVSPDALRVDADRIEARIQKLARIGANPEGGVSRVAFGEADLEGREYIVSLMREAGLEVRVATTMVMSASSPPSSVLRS